MKDTDPFDDLDAEDLGWNARQDAGQGEPSGARYTGLLDSAAFMDRLQPPSYVIDGLVQRAKVYSFTGATGHGKTAIAVRAAHSVATGEAFGDREVRRPGAALFLAGENPDNVRMQWLALCADLGTDSRTLPVHWHDGPFDLGVASSQLMADAAAIPNLHLVIADTLAAFFAGDDDNSNIQMLAAARRFRSLTKLPSRPAVLVPAHPAKAARKDSLVPRGGSAFLNEVDGNFSVWNEDNIATVHWQGKLRGPNFEPLTFEMMRTEPEGLRDEDGRQMPCTVARPVLIMREEQLNRERVNLEDRALEAIKANGNLSEQGLADSIGITKSRAHRLINRLETKRWIKKNGRAWVLTADGVAALNGSKAT